MGGGVYGTGPVLTASGYVMPRIKASVTPRVTGQLVELLVDVGSNVKAGDLLGRLANEDLKAREKQIEAEIGSQEAQLDEARANLEDLQLEFDRQETLVEEGAVSQSSYDAAKTALKVAGARMTSAEARLENAHATLEVIRTEIEKTYIRAPFDGTILRKEAEVGEVVGPGYGSDLSGEAFSLVTMCDMNSLEVEVDVNEAYIRRLREGMKASIVLDASPDREYRGVIRKIVPTANRQKATVQVKVRCRAVDKRVLPEMGAKVSFYEDEIAASNAERPIMIPATAIRRRGGKTVVYVVEDGKVRDVPIESGPVIGDKVQVYSGLSPGEAVIVAGPDDLVPGQKVQVSIGQN